MEHLVAKSFWLSNFFFELLLWTSSSNLGIVLDWKARELGLQVSCPNEETQSDFKSPFFKLARCNTHLSHLIGTPIYQPLRKISVCGTHSMFGQIIHRRFACDFHQWSNQKKYLVDFAKHFSLFTISLAARSRLHPPSHSVTATPDFLAEQLRSQVDDTSFLPTFSFYDSFPHTQTAS